MTRYQIILYFDTAYYIVRVLDGNWQMIAGPYITENEAKPDLGVIKKDPEYVKTFKTSL